MAAVIKTQDVAQALRPWVGAYMLESTPLAHQTADVLRSYAPYREDLFQLLKRLDSFLFMTIRRLTGGTMQVILDRGEDVRIRTGDFVWITDDVLGVLFESLSPYSVNYELIKDFSLRQQSLSALKVLYTKYQSFQSEEELQAIARLVRSLYPRERYSWWLPPAS